MWKKHEEKLNLFLFQVITLSTSKTIMFLKFWHVIYKVWFIWTKDHHHYEPFTSLFCMLFRMYEMVKDFSCTLLLYNSAYFWVISWTLNYTLKLGELKVPSTKISFKTFGKSKFKPTGKVRIQDLLVFRSR